jgi:hypothetical protein
MEDPMKRLIGVIVLGLVVAVVGMGAAGARQPGAVTAAARAPGVITGAADLSGPPLADGAPYTVLTPPQGDPAASPAAVGPTYYRTYSGIEFMPTTSNLTYSALGTGRYALAIPGCCFSLRRPLDLPNGAQMTAITLYAIDNDVTYDIVLQLYRIAPSAGGSQAELDSLATIGANASSQTVTSTGSPITTIDNSLYAYSLRYAPVITGQDHLLVGVRVEYTVPTAFLPFVSR